jgi:hypothetical protein
MKGPLIIVVFLLIGMNTSAQNDHAENIKRDGNNMINYMIEKDYESLSQFTYPVIVEWMGGKESMINLVSKEMQRIEDQGVVFLELSLGEPEKLYTAGEEIHCLVPQKVILENRDGKIISSSHLLAVSADLGENWYFVDTAQLTSENVTVLFPRFNSDLKIPTKIQPEFILN